MNHSVRETTNRFLLILLSATPALLSLRVIEFFYLKSGQSDIWTLLLWEGHGAATDMLLFFTISCILLIPYIALSKLNSRAATLFITTIFILYGIANLLLVLYFKRTLVPLDQVILFYSPAEILRIIASSTEVTPLEILLFPALILAPFGIFFLLRTRQIHVKVMVPLLILILGAAISYHFLRPRQEDAANNFELAVKSNKSDYFIRSLAGTVKAKQQINWSDTTGGGIIKRYQLNNPQFNYSDPHFPLVHPDRTVDILSNHFSFGTKKPNIVIVIVESLSGSFFGEDPHYGSFMPFLDSLTQHSLYWPNFLSTSERTFNVLPALLGSLPFSHEVFRRPESPPNFSLIRYLGENGYHTNFFYGGDLGLGGFNRYIENQQTDYILPYYAVTDNAKLKAGKAMQWGDHDHILFEKAAAVLKSADHKPRLDIYLTLSLHAPFTTPDDAKYNQLLRDRLKQIPATHERRRLIETHSSIFSTILYTDDALRSLFNHYKNRDDFGNTIFLITGDHSLPELPYTYNNLLEKYHVPFVIYSPMLQAPAKFQSISSHLDVTPSLLAMLSQQGFVTKRPESHWLGAGIDDEPTFRNRNKVSFIQNNRAQEEFINRNYFFSVGRLFQILPGLRLLPLQDKKLREHLIREQEDYLAITEAITHRAGLFNDSLLVYDNYMPELFGRKWCNGYYDDRSSDEYIGIAARQPLPEKYSLLKVDVGLQIRPMEDGNKKMPGVVVQILNEQGGNLYWQIFNLEKPPAGLNEDYRRCVATIDLALLESQGKRTLLIYLYNQERKEFLLRTHNTELTGYYRKW